MLATAAVALLGLTYAVVRVSWFTVTSGYCADGLCTPSAVTGAEAVTGADAMIAGNDALAAVGLDDGIVTVFGYAFFTLWLFGLALMLLVLAAWALGGHPREWRGFFAESAAVMPLRLVTLAATGFVLVYLVNLPRMMWFTNVVE